MRSCAPDHRRCEMCSRKVDGPPSCHGVVAGCVLPPARDSRAKPDLEASKSVFFFFLIYLYFSYLEWCCSEIFAVDSSLKVWHATSLSKRRPRSEYDRGRLSVGCWRQEFTSAIISATSMVISVGACHDRGVDDDRRNDRGSTKAGPVSRERMVRV